MPSSAAPSAGALARRSGAQGELTCQGCGRLYQSPRNEYLDLRPADAFTEHANTLDEALHADARHERVSPPLLGSKIRNDMLREFLRPGPGDLGLVDLGCGSGRALIWNRNLGAEAIGIDISPFFSEDARQEVPLLLGDLRRLPFADGTFSKAWSLDVLEHLSPKRCAGCWRKRIVCWRQGAGSSSTRTSARTRPSRSACAGSTGSRADSSVSA